MDLRSVKSTDHRKSFWLSLVLDKFPNSEPDYGLSLPSSDLERFICFHPSWENSVLIVTTLSISIYQRIFIMGIMGTPTHGGCRRNLWRISRSSLQLQNGLTVQWIQSIQWIWWIYLSMLFRPKPKTLSQVFSNALCRCIIVFVFIVWIILVFEPTWEKVGIVITFPIFGRWFVARYPAIGP